MLSGFIITYAIIFALLMVTTCLKKYKKYYTLAKTINSLAFIGIAVYGGIAMGNRSDLIYILPALILCLCGDILLGLDTQRNNNALFLGGLFAFTIAHIAYTVAFSRIVPLKLYDFILPVFSVFITNELTKIKNMDVKKELKKYALLYSFFVTMLLTKGMSVILVDGFITKNILIFIGSLLFFISDFIIFFLYFYKKKHVLVGVFNLLFYYTGMLLLALSVWY